jgi:hypothetical protein
MRKFIRLHRSKAISRLHKGVNNDNLLPSTSIDLADSEVEGL